MKIIRLFEMITLAGFAASASAADFDIVHYGAIGDGATVNTAAIQKAIDACHAGGGGKVRFPAGKFVTGTIQLKDNVTLQLAAETVVLGSANPTDYRNVDEFMAGDGIPLGHALIVADGVKNVGIEGAGLIDGQGKAVKEAQKDKWTVRPMLIRWLRCKGVTMRNVRLTHPGAWTLNFFQSQDIVVEGLNIRTRDTGLRNNDGIDLDSCQNARISNCDIDSGDDAFCLKSTSPIPTRDIVATNLKLSTKCNAIKLGTESLGGFENIQVKVVEIYNVGMAGIALYTVDGGPLTNVMIENVKMNNVNAAISVRLGARLKTFRPQDEKKPTGVLRDVVLRGINAAGAGAIGILINGIPGHCVENLTLEGIDITVRGGGKAEDAKITVPENEAAYPEWRTFGTRFPAYGIFVRHARGLILQNVRVRTAEPDARQEKVFIDVENPKPPQ